MLCHNKSLTIIVINYDNIFLFFDFIDDWSVYPSSPHNLL